MTVRCGHEPVLIDRVRPLRSALLVSTALQAVAMALAMPAGAQPAPNARPTGGSVVAGSAVISNNQSRTTIDQASNRAAIDWQSFNVGSQQSVQFKQPSSSAVALNRVVGPDPSAIAGRIDANGQLVLINQSGVVFSKGAQVNAAGLVVSAANLSNQNFMAGRMVLDQPGRPNARVANAGTITIKDAGIAALVAPQVANSGVINAKLGHVVLAGANAATLDLYGDGLLSIDVTRQVTQAPLGPDGKPVTALVTNDGVIRADGGTVQLTAQAADGVVRTLVDAGGSIRAATVGSKAGTIALNGVGGSIVVEGQLSAPGLAPGTRGGNIEVAGRDSVLIASGAKLNASGKAGGGTIAVGTTLARARTQTGKAGIPPGTSQQVAFAEGAKISADGLGTGSGGQVAVLSAQSTQAGGVITALGGPQGGDGGQIEISGGKGLSITAGVDTTAPNGLMGTLLIDPTDLLIGFSDTNSPISQPSGGGGGAPATGTQNISAQTFNSFRDNITLSADNAIELGGGTALIPVADVHLMANAIVVGVDLRPLGVVTLTGGSAAGNVTLVTPNPLPVVPTGVTVNRNVTVAGISIALSGNSLSINGALAANQGDGLGPVTLTATGGIASTGGITASNLTGSAGGDASFSGANAISFLGPFAATGALSLTNGAPLTVDGAVQAASITLQSPPGIALGTTSGGTDLTDGTLTTVPNGGRISLVTDTLEVLTAASKINAPGGTVELVPATPGTPVTVSQIFAANPPIPASVLASATDLSISSRVLAAIVPAGQQPVANTLRIGLLTPEATPRAGSIAFAGPTNFTGLATIVELDTTGPITQTGGSTVTAPTLTGRAGSVSLTEPTNAIATLGNFSVASAGAFGLVDTGTLTVSGILSAPAISLRSDSIAIPGTVTDGGAGTVSLTASTGGITETGTLIAGTLSGSAATNVSLTGATATTNQIARLGNFDATSTFSLNDGASLLVTGPAVGGGTNLTIADNGSLTIDGSANQGSILSLPAQTNLLQAIGGISINPSTILTLALDPTLTMTTKTGDITLGLGSPINVGVAGVGAITMRAGVGGSSSAQINLNSGVSAGRDEFTSQPLGSITLQAAGGINLNSAPLVAATVDLSNLSSGGVTQTGAGITATTLQSALGVVGPASLSGSNAIANIGNFQVTGGSFVLSDTGPLSVNGTLSAPAINLAADSIAIPGTVTDGGSGSVNLTAISGGISETGTLITGALSGSAATDAVFTGATPASNQIVALAGFSATTGFALNDASGLSVTGPVSGGSSATIVAGGPLTIGGSISATQIDLAGTDIAIPGVVTDGGTGATSLTATTGGIAETGTLVAGNLSVNAPGAVSLTGAFQDTNQIEFLGPVSTAGDLSVNDGAFLTVVGTVSAASITLQAGPGISLGFGVFGDAVQGDLAVPNGRRISLVTDTLNVLSPGSISAPGGTVELVPFTIGSAVTVGQATASDLTITPDALVGISPATGTLRIGLLTGETTPRAGSINFAAATDLTGVARTVELDTTGTITQAAGATLTAATLTGQAGQSVMLTQPNQIATLGGFTVGSGAFALTDNQPLTINGPLSAPDLQVSAIGQITLNGNIQTTGASLVAQSGPAPAPSGSFLTVQPNGAGAASLVQTGTTSVEGLGGDTAILRLQLPPAGGTMSFNDLQASAANLVLGLGSGTATGLIRVGGLLVLGEGGSATLVGSVAGNNGPGAAQLAAIQPAPSLAYTFNNCEIGATLCTGPIIIVPPTTPPITLTDNVQTSVLGGLEYFGFVPTGLPPVAALPHLEFLALPSLAAPRRQLTDPDVVPPNVSVRDY